MDVLSAALSAMVPVAALGFTAVALLRQNGRLLTRMDALEAQVGQAPLESPGLPMDVQSLAVRANLPPVVTKGGAVPTYELADLDGKMVDLAWFRGRNTVLLFWDPASSQCQSMLPDLKTLTRVRLTGVPDVVIVASRPVSARALGLEIPVLRPNVRADGTGALRPY